MRLRFWAAVPIAAAAFMLRASTPAETAQAVFVQCRSSGSVREDLA